MDSKQRTEIKQIATLRSGKWATGAAAMLLSASLLLSACGGSSDPVVQSTPVATMAAPATNTPAASDASTTPEVDDSEAMTDTEGVEGSDTTTDTEGVEGSDTMTGTEGVDDSETMTGTEEVDETDTTTGTGEVGDSDTMTDTEAVDDSDTMTGTEDVDDTDTTTGTSATDSTDNMALMGVSGVSPKQYVRASTLLDYDFENLNNEVSGDLEDLLIDLSTGRVLFASIEYGGVLDLGDKDIVIPMNAFTIGDEGELVLNIEETELESYPDVGNDWPDLNDPAWDDDVNTYWTDTGIDVGPGYSEGTTNVGWASDIIGRNIADLGFGAGSVLDILVNLGTGHAPYLVVDYGEGLDTDPYIIPLSAYDVSDWNNEFAYGPDFTPDILETAPRWDRELYPEGTAFDEEFGDNLESTWNDLGFSNDLNNDGEID